MTALPTAIPETAPAESGARLLVNGTEEGFDSNVAADTRDDVEDVKLVEVDEIVDDDVVCKVLELEEIEILLMERVDWVSVLREDDELEIVLEVATVDCKDVLEVATGDCEDMLSYVDNAGCNEAEDVVSDNLYNAEAKLVSVIELD